LFGHFLAGSGVADAGELGQHRGVEPVGLGQPAQRAGEVARLPRVDHRDVEAGF